MKSIVFFDIKEYEKEYFKNKFKNKFNLIFDENALLKGTKIPAEAINSEILSVFTSSRLTKEVLEQFKNLKLIATRSVGFSHIDIDYCKAKDIKVVNTPHYGDYTVAEYSFGLLLNIIRKICKANHDLKEDNLNSTYTGMELFGKTIGIIGTGGIGSKAVKIANGFSMEILAYDIYPNKELEEKYGAKYVELENLIKNSDIIALYSALTKDNYHMLNSEMFNKMKDGVVIINASRGEVIDTGALYSSLKAGKVKAAALDVLECEENLLDECGDIDSTECPDLNCLKRTLLNHKLLTLPNVIVTPHIAYDTQAAINRILEITGNNIVAYSDNLDIENQVI